MTQRLPMRLVNGVVMLCATGAWSGCATGQNALPDEPRAPATPISLRLRSDARSQPLPDTAAAQPAGTVFCSEPLPALTHCGLDAARPDAHAAAIDPTRSLLEFADRMRSASPAERARELSRANAPMRGNGRKDAAGNGADSPVQQLQLALVLGQIRPGADLGRAQQLAQTVANSAHPDAQPIKPLARLLAARFAEQRRLEEQLERTEQQLREQRQRLAKATQRLEAVRAIERSLGPAPPDPPVLQPPPAAPAASGAAAVPAGPR